MVVSTWFTMPIERRIESFPDFHVDTSNPYEAKVESKFEQLDTNGGNILAKLVHTLAEEFKSVQVNLGSIRGSNAYGNCIVEGLQVMYNRFQDREVRIHDYNPVVNSVAALK